MYRHTDGTSTVMYWANKEEERKQLKYRDRKHVFKKKDTDSGATVLVCSLHKQHRNAATKWHSGLTNAAHLPSVTILSAGIQGPWLPGVHTTHKYRHNIELLLHIETRLTELTAATCRLLPYTSTAHRNAVT